MLILTFVWAKLLSAQLPDSLQQLGEEVIGRKIEQLELASEADIDLSELTDNLEYFLEIPLQINSADKKDLELLGLLNDIQIKNILDYRKKYGIFLSIYELNAIEGMSRNTIEKIAPFIVVAPPAKKVASAKQFLRGKHEMIIRYQRKLVSQSGYTLPPDSLQESGPGSFYLGNPDRYYFRYRYTVRELLSMGITAEKDPGELLFKIPDAICDPIKAEINNTRGPDFLSAHLEMKNIGIFRSIIVGDFHVQCGQGLVLWTGLSFSGGNSPSAFKRFSNIIKPNTSTNENRFMRGLATRINWKNLDLSIFYSRKYTDANIISGTEEGVSSMPEGGYHRTFNELQDKNTLLQQHFGGHLSYSNNRFRAGITAFNTRFDIGITPPDEASGIYRFTGKENINAGINFDVLLRKTNLFGEAGYSINGGWALLTGITHNTDNGSIFSILFREYRKDYQNLSAQAMGKRDGNANERGIKMAMELAVHRTTSLLLFTEHYTYPWLTTRNINVFRGQEHELALNFKPGNSIFSLRYRFTKSVTKNNANLNWLDEMQQEQKQKIRLQARQMVSPSFSIKGQIEFIHVKNYSPMKESKGTLMFMDIFYHPPLAPIKISFRYALFHTDDYDSRLYAYENDVLYASSMPAYYGRGFRTYVLISYKPLDWMQLWLRFSLTNYTDRNTISSGTEEIIGNKVPEIKLQMRVKL